MGKKIGLLLVMISMMMIGSACLLEYIAFKETPVVETRHHEKVTLKDMMEARTLLVKEKEEQVEEEPTVTEKQIAIQEVIETKEPIEDVTVEVAQPVVFEDMTLEQLGEKLNRSLHSNIAGYGPVIAAIAIERGMDPYLSVAIILHETGCKWSCSYLVQACNNVGGQKGGPSCNGGAYKAYATLEEGITGYMDNLYNNYYAHGLNTAETIAQKYVGTSSWSEWVAKVNDYIAAIRAA